MHVSDGIHTEVADGADVKAMGCGGSAVGSGSGSHRLQRIAMFRPVVERLRELAIHDFEKAMRVGVIVNR